jgi:hypothetical protein
MSTTIELAPQLQAELTRQAAKRGVGVDAYAAGLLENATRFSNDPAPVADNPQSALPAKLSRLSRPLKALEKPTVSRSAA